MKKIIMGMLALLLVIPAGVPSVHAATNCPMETVCPQNGSNFVDANNDGVCDNWNGCANWADKNSDGVCDNCTGTHKSGCRFTDTNKDGICDNRNATSSKAHHSGHHGKHR